MPIQILCPSCKKKLQVADNTAGKKVKCPNPECKLVFPVKAPPAPVPTTPSVVVQVSSLPPDTRVFISHAVADRQTVESSVVSFFRNHNIATWYCSDDIAGGTPFQQQIVDGLNKSDWFVLVLSARALDSEAVRQEVEIAFETKRGRILPILIEACSIDKIKLLHNELAAIYYEDFTGDLPRAQRKLLVSMVRQLSKERSDLEMTADHQSLTIEDLKTETAQLAARQRELEAMVKRAAAFDGEWSSNGKAGTVPVFCPLKTRGIPIIAVCNLKGGVGKTTLTANLGATLWGDPIRKRVLLIDLDYQGSLSTICLDGRVRQKLTQQQRFVQEVFKHPEPDGKLIIQLAHEVKDDRTKNHGASIVAADEDLARAEGEVLGRWMMQDKGIDGRYLLRHVLHTNVIQKNFDIVLIDCPPRMTAASINAFLAADFLLIPTPLEEVSAEAVPRMLRWVRERRENLLSNLDVLGVVVSRTRQAALIEHEKEILDRLKDDCKDAWGDRARVFGTCIPIFPAVTTSYQFPAQHLKLRQVFADLVKEINKRMPAVTVPVPATASVRPAKPFMSNKAP